MQGQGRKVESETGHARRHECIRHSDEGRARPPRTRPPLTMETAAAMAAAACHPLSLTRAVWCLACQVVRDATALDALDASCRTKTSLNICTRILRLSEGGISIAWHVLEVRYSGCTGLSRPADPPDPPYAGRTAKRESLLHLHLHSCSSRHLPRRSHLRHLHQHVWSHRLR